MITKALLDEKVIDATVIGDDWAAKDGDETIVVTPEMRENADASGAITLPDGRTITFLAPVHPHVAYVEIDPDFIWDDVEREAGKELEGITNVQKARAVEDSAYTMLENNGYERLVIEVVEGLKEVV